MTRTASPAADRTAADRPIEHRSTVAGYPIEGDNRLAVRDKHTGDEMGGVALASPDDVDRAIASAFTARSTAAATTPNQRAGILRAMADAVEHHSDRFARILAREAGKPIKDAAGEVGRCVITLRLCAEEAQRHTGETLVLDQAGDASTRITGVVERVPVGAVSLITPFNFPLNLVAHKVGPAIAAGCPFVLKPSDKAPLCAFELCAMLAETDWPEDAWSVLLCDVEHIAPLVEDDRFALLSFTGSDKVGWDLKRRAGKKRVALELGGDAACIVHHDAELDHAADRVTHGSFYSAGQSCISTQRVLVHAAIADRFRDLLVERIGQLVDGDPMHPDTFLGPMIDADAADRAMSWIDEAREKGAAILTGGQRRGNTILPTLIEDLPDNCALAREEAFAPVAILHRYDALDDAIALVNRSRFGIHVGIFTHDARTIRAVFDGCEVGGVIVNDVPSWRADAMPYGGVKDSGLGREGPRYAIEEMTERRTLVLHEPRVAARGDRA